ncbi:MAG: hypothetical protein J3R72DRAFT_486378 [Linnemannia gamsii]|nr:MAG: hypothetical protein J3R72DRAFT_486378 [Linnemannia gamsii]
MSLNVGAIPALEQMGLYEDLWKVLLHSGGRFKIYDSDLSLLYSLNTIIEYVEFKEERFTHVQAQYDASKMDSRLIYG